MILMNILKPLINKKYIKSSSIKINKLKNGRNCPHSRRTIINKIGAN